MAFGVAETAKLLIDLSLKGNFLSQLSKVNSALGKLDTKLDHTQSKAYRVGQVIGTGIKAGAVVAASAIGFLASQVGFGLQQLIELEDQTTQTNAVLASTKGVAGQTAASIRNLAEKYEALNATIDDKVIQSGENVLLTFTNIRKDAFEPALAAALDLSTAMHQDLQTSIVQVGKALNDPAKGLTSLQRIGVSFSKQQKEQIANFLKEGKVADAQRVILAELGREFGGSFAKGGDTARAKIAKLGDAIEDLQLALATALFPTLIKGTDALSKFLAKPETIKGVENLGKKLGELFDKGLEVAKKIPWGIIGDSLKLAADSAIKILDTFNKFPDWVKKAIITGAIIKIATGLIPGQGGGGGGGGGGGIVDSIVKGTATGVASAIAGTLIKSLGITTLTNAITTLGGAITSLALPTAIAGAIIATAGTIARIIDPTATGTGKPGSPVVETLSNRDPRRFDANGRIIQNSVQHGVEAGLPDNLAKSQDIESLRGGIIAAINQKPTGGGDRGKGSQGDMEGRRGAIGDALSAAVAAQIASGLKAALTGSSTFVPTVKLDASQITDLRQDDTNRAIEDLRGNIATGLADTTAGVESVRGQIASGLQPNVTAVELAARGAGQAVVGAINSKDLSIDQSIKINVNVSAAGVSKSVTIQNRYGPGNGSSGDDFRGGKPPGGQ